MSVEVRQPTEACACQMCNRQAQITYESSAGTTSEITCLLCGTYTFETRRIDIFGRHQGVLPALMCATRQASERGQPAFLSDKTIPKLAREHTDTRIADNQERLLREIGWRAPRPTSSASISSVNDFTIIDCFNGQEFVVHLNWLKVGNFIHLTGGPNGTYTVQLTLAGWNRVQPLAPSGGIPGRCFVAMSFDPSLDSTFDEGIAPAVTDCGFPSPLRIDRKEHNNQITDEIIAAIRDAQFIIADFTGQRAGVYYEAGFARGLGRPVISTCKSSDITGLHFDTKVISHVAWNDAADLREKLARRIKATIIPNA